MSTMNFCVVEFDDGVQVVPENWISGEMCFWPPLFKSNTRFEKAVKGFEMPNSELWTLHKCHILGVYASYDVARAKLKSAEEKTDIDCSTDSEQARKRRKFKKRIILDDSSDGTSSDNAHSTTIIEKFPSPPIKKLAKRTENVPTPTTSALGQPVRKSTPVVQCSETGQTQKFREEDDFQQRIFRELAAIKIDLRRLQESVDNINRESHNSKSRQVDNDVLTNFPITDDEQLGIVETSLASNEEFKTRLIDRLGHMGGTTEDEVTKRILKLVFADTFALRFSWCAGKGKMNFSNLQLSQVIIKAVQFHNNNFTDLKIIRSIQNWLRHASARHANKEKRLQKNNINNVIP